MLKKITRRRFVSSLSVLAAMPLLSPRSVRAATGKTVSVDRYNNNDWIAAFKQAFAEGDTVVVPAGLTCENINTGIFIPDGKTLLIRGALKGNGRGRFVLQEGCKVIGEGEGRTHNITLDVRGSDCVIKGLAMSGFGPVTQIYIGGKKPRVMRNLLIDTPFCARVFIIRWTVRALPTVNSATCRGTRLSGTWRLTTAIS